MTDEELYASAANNSTGAVVILSRTPMATRNGWMS